MLVIPYRERLNLTAEGDTAVISSSPVRYGWYREIQRVTIINKTEARGKAVPLIGGYGYNHVIDSTLNLSTDWQNLLCGEIVLREEEYIQVVFSELMAGDNIEVILTGYEEQIVSSE